MIASGAKNSSKMGASSENVSEKITKRKGRPPNFTLSENKLLRPVSPNTEVFFCVIYDFVRWRYPRIFQR